MLHIEVVYGKAGYARRKQGKPEPLPPEVPDTWLWRAAGRTPRQSSTPLMSLVPSLGRQRVALAGGRVRAAGLPLPHLGHAEHEAVLREVLKTSAVCCPLTVWTSLRPVRCGWSSRPGCRSEEGGSSVVHGGFKEHGAPAAGASCISRGGYGLNRTTWSPSRHPAGQTVTSSYMMCRNGCSMPLGITESVGTGLV